MNIPIHQQLDSVKCKELIAEYKINAKLVECFSSECIHVSVYGNEVVVYKDNEYASEFVTNIDINLYNYNVNEIVKKIVRICDNII